MPYLSYFIIFATLKVKHIKTKMYEKIKMHSSLFTRTSTKLNSFIFEELLELLNSLL